MRRRGVPLILLAALAACGSGNRMQTDETARTGPTGSGAARQVKVEVPAGWAPEGPYWDAYPAVFLEVACDSAGVVVAADTLYSAATATETDSALARVRGTRFDVRRSAGRVGRRGWDAPSDTTTHFIVPCVTHDLDGNAPPPLVTGEELEMAGLGRWLSIWKELIPDWPVETWRYEWTSKLYEPAESTVVDDRKMVALGMVSVSPDAAWRIEPFMGAEITPDGKILRDVDSGFSVYRSGGKRQRVRHQVTGTPVRYDVADWIDSKRFVVAGMQMVDLGYEGNVLTYSAPMLILGNVDSLRVTGILGPPVPAWSAGKVWEKLDGFQRLRYPEVWKAEHRR